MKARPEVSMTLSDSRMIHIGIKPDGESSIKARSEVSLTVEEARLAAYIADGLRYFCNEKELDGLKNHPVYVFNEADEEMQKTVKCKWKQWITAYGTKRYVLELLDENPTRKCKHVDDIQDAVGIDGVFTCPMYVYKQFSFLSNKK